MKKLMLGLCLAALGVACRSSGADVHDTSCTGADCAECTTKCSGEEMESCSGEKAAECKGEGQVCPVTGKTMN